MYIWLARCALWVAGRYVVAMISWASRWAWWFASRSVVTLVCIITVQNLLHHEGYLVEFKILALGAVCLILGVGVWMRLPSPEKPKQDTSWGG